MNTAETMSAVACEHANECPTGLCACPENCYCKRTRYFGGSGMCVPKFLSSPQPQPPHHKQVHQPNQQREAGRKGGITTKAKYGPEYYKQLGKKGGDAMKARGPEYFVALGRMGGTKVRDEKGSAHFSEMGRKGGARMRELIAAGKKVEEQQR